MTAIDNNKMIQEIWADAHDTRHSISI